MRSMLALRRGAAGGGRLAAAPTGWMTVLCGLAALQITARLLPEPDPLFAPDAFDVPFGEGRR